MRPSDVILKLAREYDSKVRKDFNRKVPSDRGLVLAMLVYLNEQKLSCNQLEETWKEG